MRSGITPGVIAMAIIMTLALSLPGCGRKAPLTLPSPKPRAEPSQTPQPQATQAPASGLQPSDTQKTAAPPSQQNIEP